MARLFFNPEEVKEGIAAKTQSDGLERNNLLRCDVSEIDVGTQKFDEPYLLCFLRSFPDNFFKRYFGKDLLHET